MARIGSTGIPNPYRFFGTFAGVPVLRRIPDAAYKRIVGLLLLSLGVYMLLRGLQGK